MRHLAACLLLLAACGRREPPRAPDLVDLLNGYRRAAGVATVSKDEVLARAAAAHAAEMERLGYNGHFSPTPGNRSPDDRLAREGWPADRRYFELLALADTPEAALASWKARPAYDRALLDPEHGTIGV
ncbi:MAG: CAP domain-containing protein, partial [Planctomycetota bacterium]